MEFVLKHNTAEKARSACQIITVTQPRKLSASGQRVDKANKGMLSAILKRGDMDGTAVKPCCCHPPVSTVCNACCWSAAARKAR